MGGLDKNRKSHSHLDLEDASSENFKMTIVIYRYIVIEQLKYVFHFKGKRARVSSWHLWEIEERWSATE